jgi:alpha,alpha-trehalase
MAALTRALQSVAQGRRRTLRKQTFGAVLCALLLAGTTPVRSQDFTPLPPSIEFGQLFRDVQLQSVFPDQKTFCDLNPNAPPPQIKVEYRLQQSQPGFDLATFVSQNFTSPGTGANISPAAPGQEIKAYIASLWDLLTEDATSVPPYSSLLSLPYPFVVPGGRFTEVYYWDTYFTTLGLEQDARNDLAENLVKDIAYEIDTYGHVPNGNRTYYLSRSQPPFFAKVVDLIAQADGDAAYQLYLPELQSEYDYWMEGSDKVQPGHAYHNVVRLADGTLLNRYWDARNVPRDESYSEDVQTAAQSNRSAAEVYRDLRAAAESGWDFSSRWLADGKTLATIRTTQIVPVDLNSLLFHLEETLAKAYRLKGDADAADSFEHRAADRKAAIQTLMWDAQGGFFTDYLWRQQQLTHTETAATLYPLFLEVATDEQAETVAATVNRDLLMPGGVATSLVNSGQQWDLPNGWAPLQWIAVSGFNTYGHADLAQTIATRWVNKNVAGYQQVGKMVEKYNVTTTTGDFAGGGGEYATQIGFGWTNGVFLQLLSLYPDLATNVVFPGTQAAATAQ